MGTVYLAECVRAPGDGLAAIKVVRWYSHEISRRFQQEQAILSGLRHPNIARLLDSGTTASHSPYFVMEYVEGMPIHAYCDARSLSTDGSILLFRQVCAAVSYLHRHLVVHRDLKPGNVLVTSDGTVKLVDFGIAKLLQSSDDLLSPVNTIAGLMTPDYASPEQIRGGATSTLTDVYSLGVLLYELLTGERPFTAPIDQIHETLRRICEEEPLRPSLVRGRGGPARRDFGGEIDNIILKALRKEPERRYASVEQFDEDLRRFLNREAVLAQGDSLAYLARKFAARHKGGVAAGLAMLLLLAGGVVATSNEARVAFEERVRAESQAREAQSARVLAESRRIAAEQQRAEANVQRALAEQHALEAERERANAERRLGELQKLANGVVRIYNANGAPDASAVIAENVRNSLLALRQERRLEPGLADALDRTSATVQSYELANDPSWQIPEGWTAKETGSHEYRVGRDRNIVHGGKWSLFLRSLVAQPSGTVLVTQGFDSKKFRGKRIRVTAFLRSEAVRGQAGLRVNVSFQYARAELSGTTSWKKYALVVDVPSTSESIQFVLMLNGTGTLWADDFTFEEVSSSVPVNIRQPQNLGFSEPTSK